MREREPEVYRRRAGGPAAARLLEPPPRGTGGRPLPPALDRGADSVLPQDTIDAIREHLLASTKVDCTGCRYCDFCPEDIPVPQYMDAYNQKLLTDSNKEMINRLRFHWGMDPNNLDLDRCTECRACEEACTQVLPILERFEEIRQAVKKR